MADEEAVEEEVGADGARTRLLGADYYERFKESESYSTWEHFINRGHVGKVQCVASSDATDYIVSGGEDYTMRIWVYDQGADGSSEHASLSYDLIAVLLHDDEHHADQVSVSKGSLTQDRSSSFFSHLFPRSAGEGSSGVMRGVTAVACVGNRGPFASGTARGDLFVLFLGSEEAEGSCLPQIGLHEDTINEIATPSGLGDVGQESAWLLAVAGEDGMASVLLFQGDTSSGIVFLHHDGQAVRGVRHIAGGGEEDASVATHTERMAFIWNLKGERLLQLDPEAATGTAKPPIEGFAVANRDDGSLLFVGAQETIAVWAFEKGRLCGPHGECPPPEPYDKAPLVTYKDTPTGLNVDQSRESTEFIVNMRDDYICAVWNVKGVQHGQLAIEPRGPAALLAAERRRAMLLDLRHQARVQQICVAEDPEDAGGPCLIAACGDGSVLLWDLEGVDRGEVYGALRSLRPVEIFLPIVLLLISFFQVMSFAFGPAVKWRDEVRRPAHFTQKIVWGGFVWSLTVRRDLIFLPMMWTVLGLMILFLVCAVTGMPDLLQYCIYLTQSTNVYKYETKNGYKALGRTFSRMHLLKKILEALRSVIGFMMLLCSTILVAPMFKACAQALHCIHKDTPQRYLAVAPQVRCYEGEHLQLFVTVLVVLPLYFVALMPYAVVEGDVNYMKWRKLFLPREHWAESALRKATVVNLGPLHPDPNFVFRTLSLDLAAKALLPVIETETTHTPRLQMLLITSVGLLMYVSSLRFPAKMDRKFCCLVQDTRLFTLCAMLCGCLTVELPEDSMLPVVLLGVCMVLVPVKTALTVMQSPLQPPAVMRCKTSTVRAAEREEEERTGAGNEAYNEANQAVTPVPARSSSASWASRTNWFRENNTAANQMNKHRRGVKGVMKKMEIKLF